MPTNNFKLFDENKANILSDTEYGNSTQRLNGVQTGVASSQLNNKFAYQVSLVAYAIAQLMNANGLDASDTLSVSAFVGNLQGAILQKVADKATSSEAAAGVIANKYITPQTMKAAALLLSGGVMSGVLNMGGNKITDLGTPTATSDAVTKGYVDDIQAFNTKDIGTFTTTNTILNCAEDDILKCTGILLDLSFSSSIITSGSIGTISIGFTDNDPIGNPSESYTSYVEILDSRVTNFNSPLSIRLIYIKSSYMLQTINSSNIVSISFYPKFECSAASLCHFLKIKFANLRLSGFKIVAKFLM